MDKKNIENCNKLLSPDSISCIRSVLNGAVRHYCYWLLNYHTDVSTRITPEDIFELRLVTYSGPHRKNF